MISFKLSLLKEIYKKALAKELIEELKEPIDKENRTSETEFYIIDGVNDNSYNAYSWTDRNVIEIGINALTIETLIHELNEIEITYILETLGVGNPTLELKENLAKYYTSKYNYVSHFSSPYGWNSIINPCITKYGELPINEEWLNK